MKLLVTGRQGQLARSLIERVAGEPGFHLIAAGRPALDLADAAGLRRIVMAEHPDLVISAAAYTAVDRAEDEPEIAHAVNAGGAGALAEAAAAIGAPIVHLSTDYVFSGDAAGAYREDDATGPQSVYGLSKLAGERAVAAANPQHVIVRTAWIYSPFGTNFVKTMLRLAGDRDEIAVVADQWGNPTAASDIADGILGVARRLAAGRSPELFGIFHLAGTGAVNWSGFAAAIMAESVRHGGPAAAIRPIATAQFPTKARRPANSRLNTDKFARIYGWRAPPWQASLAATVARLRGSPSQ